MLARHVAAHLHQVFAELIRRVINAEDGIKAGDDRALRTRFAAEGLTLPSVRGDTFVDEAARKCRVIPPPEDVRANAVVVDVWIARFGHALHRPENPIKRITELVQRSSGLAVVAIGDRRLRVRANAETPLDAKVARDFGAEGIGLCRTEHMFLAPDRLPVVRRMILASTPAEEAAALDELRKVQTEDFAALLRAMSGLPVTVRLLDPPLHEFLPSVDELEIKKATVGLTAEESKLMDAAHSWAEVNPMLGTRGVRLGVIKPGLYAMQVRALLAAADIVASEGFSPIVEVMIPLTVTKEELALARSWVEQEILDHSKQLKPAAKSGAKTSIKKSIKKSKRPKVTIGTMIETPRAALVAGELAEISDFFSFGTNDLTQMTFGFSRDDVESRMMPAYLEAGLLKRNPFETIDQVGVGELVKIAAARGRKAKRGIKLGVCGEHGGDPESIGLFYRAGLDYVSCSPYRIPIARLAAAQAIIGGSKAETK